MLMLYALLLYALDASNLSQVREIPATSIVDEVQ